MGLSMLSGFIEILKETLKIHKSKNGKLISKITSIYIILICVVSISYQNLMTTFSQHDLLAKETNSPTPPSFTEIYASTKPDVILFHVASLLLTVFAFILTIFFMTSTILASAATYPSETTIFSFKELKVKVKASIKRPIITKLCIYLMVMGFYFMGLCLFGILAFLVENGSVLLMAVVGIFLATILWVYLSVVFHLALVVSIIEEGVCGFQAIAKARRLVKGKRMDGFVMNLAVSTAIMIVSIPNMRKNQSMVQKMLAAAVISTFGGALSMFQHMFYTVLYCQCKKINDESEVGLLGDYEYV